MLVKLLWIERDFRGQELSRRQETLKGESFKTPTRNQISRLIRRCHPELSSVDHVHLIDSDQDGYRWYVRSIQLHKNRWVTIYAEPIDEMVAQTADNQQCPPAC